MPPWLLATIRVALLPFTAGLAWLSADPRRLSTGARWVLTADAAWIGGATAVLAGLPAAMSATGNAALAAVTLVVAVFVVGQAVGLRRLSGVAHPRQAGDG